LHNAVNETFRIISEKRAPGHPGSLDSTNDKYVWDIVEVEENIIEVPWQAHSCGWP
jgi:hypothetical protein